MRFVFFVLTSGIPNLITADMIKEGAAVIDVGINRVQDPVTGKNRLVGDVDFEGEPQLWMCLRLLQTFLVLRIVVLVHFHSAQKCELEMPMENIPRWKLPCFDKSVYPCLRLYVGWFGKTATKLKYKLFKWNWNSHFILAVYQHFKNIVVSLCNLTVCVCDVLLSLCL